MKRFVCISLALLSLFAPAGAAIAQQDEEAERSRFVRFVEDQISSPNMQIRLIGLEGTLSRDVSLERITISDEEGVWLTIEAPRFRWNRSALLRRNLVINELSAESLTFPRRPVADEALPSPEATSFALPELPVSIRIDELDLPRAEFGEPVFGLAAALSLDGSLLLDDGTLDADLDIVRLDATGGELGLDIALADDRLDLDVSLQEPADGVVANLIGIPERPPVSLSLTGGGPLDALDVDLAFNVDGAPILSGNVETSRGLLGGATRARFDLSGPLADILPPRERAFFGDDTALRGELVFGDDGTVIEQIAIDSGALSAEASGRLLPGGFPANLDLQAALETSDGDPVALPGADRATLAGARLTLAYGGADWRLEAVLDELRTPDLTLAGATITGNGTVENLRDPESRAVSFDLAAAGEGYAPADADLAEAVGTEPSLTATGQWQAGRPVAIDALEARIAAATVTGQGIFRGLAFAGRLDAAVPDLARLSGLVGRELSGSAEARLTGRVEPVGGAFDLEVDAEVSDLTAGEDLAGRVLSGDLALTGGVERSVDGLAFEAFEGRSDAVDFAINGQLASESADLDAALTLADLAVFDERSSGTAGVQLSVDRAPPPEDDADAIARDPFVIKAMLMVPEGRLAGQSVDGLRVTFDGEALDEAVRGTLAGSGSIAGEPLALDAAIERNGDEIALNGLDLSIGQARLSGVLGLTGGIADGTLSIDAEDIAALAALALVDASGAIEGTVALSGDGGKQGAAVDLTAAGLRYDTIRVGTADITADLTDLFGTIGGGAEVAATGIDAGAVTVRTLEATATTGPDQTIDFTAGARLAGGIGIDAAGDVRQDGGNMRLRLDRFSADTPYGDTRLAGPTTISLTGGVARTDALTLLVEGGRIALSGSAGAERLDLDARLTALPLSIANAFRPDLGVGGTLSGTLNITGTAQAPRVGFDLNADAVAAAALRQAGVAPFAISADGTFADDRLRLSSLSASNPQGLDLAASGTIPLTGGGLALDVSGTAPLALAEAALAGRGTQLEGTARFEGRATGAIASPSLSGLVSISGGTILDPGANLELTDVNLLAGLEGDRLVIRNGSARVAGGGGVSLAGQIGLTPPFPADLSLDLAGVRYTDGRMVTADLGADLSITGPLTGGALIAGTVDLARVEIAVPDGFGNNDELLDVRHVDPGAGTLATLRRIETLMGGGDGGEPSAPFRLDVRIRAPNQVFVRGRGLDVELGGQLGVTGTLNSIVPVGGFDLIRGRLVILNQRIDFTSGRLTLAGDLNPFVDLTAETVAGDLLVTVRLVGPASDLDLELGSSPSLPDDEIFAQLLFGSDIASLSPVQIARLADAAASLAGGGSGLTGGLRNALGVDDLDIVEGEDGGVGVRAGRYLTDNVYLELQAVGGDTETTINLDITDSLTARGSAGTDGDTSLGIFFERDY
ncbi:translocation/assembly module TamB domain-containing protein [Roseitalea porphyridii]|uniref:Translocation and assembly module TamB C-terminal domain-containing protein n=1 Tax=Roseitalea porphyridii TaxID=1852022 RepID=A0A4P6V4D2_9HYPH|nr:translocation/assembly module TamB domain-containing protein [Roseitalea porphyridii]QBK31410.1 hypothetical protein E0E05_12840 [Roseitalea porphyridii]